MTDISQTTEMPTVTPRISPERKAWGVVLLAFAIFCVLCVGLTLGVHFFFFQSTVPLEALLQVGRGTAGIVTKAEPIPEVVRSEGRLLSTGTRISTDAQTQATITFRDLNHNEQFITSVTVKRNTELAFGAASQPRFDWSVSDYFVNLYSFSGEVDIFVAEGLPRDIRLDIWTTSGSLIALGSSGHYTISASDGQVSVINRDGEAILFAPDTQINRSIPETMRGEYLTDASEITLSPAYNELLENNFFAEISPPADNGGGTDAATLPVSWACTNEQDAPPRGAYRSEVKEGRLSMRLVRNQGASSHGETRCIQAFPGQTGVDVSEYDYLALRATFYVDYQSLNVCGNDGSECPLMLRMDYIDVNGINRLWYHGFYVNDDPQANNPLRCSSCAQDHERVYGKAWYTFETGNLFTLFPPDLRPSAILVVRFYASGHQYDVYVSEVSLQSGLPTDVSGVDAGTS